MVHERLQADLDAGLAQHAHLVTEIALGLAQVVRLGEALAGERLVGDLGLAAPSVGVVDRRALRGPLDELAAGGQRRIAQLAAQVAIALRIDHDRAHTALDRAHGHPGHRDRLARAGRADHERVRTAGGAAERDCDGAAVTLVTDCQPIATPPAL